MTAKNDQKVVVGYPHYGPVEHGFMRSMLELWRYDALGGRTPAGQKVGGRRRILEGGGCVTHSTAILVRSRTDITRDFLGLGADWLFMVDDDMTFDPDVVDRLVDAAHPVDRPIVGGLCFAYMQGFSRKFWTTLYAWVPGTESLRRLTQYPADELIPVAGTGAACLLVHRSVFEAIEKKYPGPRPWFAETETGRGDGDILSEDLTFCLRAQACGFPIFVHTGIKTGHIKKFEANEGEFIAESELLRQACVPALPTYAVIASKDRPAMLATLRAQLAGQVTDTFVFDNGYDPAPAAAIEAHGWPLHRMWNTGLDMAAQAAGGPHNVLIVNDDVEVPCEFAAQLEAGLRSHDDHWIAYPNWRALDLEPGQVVRTQSDRLAGQTMSGWAFMLRGETGLRFDERFSWWYGDSDLERQVNAAGKHVVCVGGCEARHLDPLRSTLEDPARLVQAEADELLFAEKWGVDPQSLWLTQRKAPV